MGLLYWALAMDVKRRMAMVMVSLSILKRLSGKEKRSPGLGYSTVASR